MFLSKQKHLLVNQDFIVGSISRWQLRKVSLFFVGLFFLCIRTIAQTTTIGDLDYTFSGPNAIVMKYNGDGGVCSVPSKITYNGLEYNVTRIGGGAFKYATVTEIELPETIEYIGNCSFWGCKNMTKINLPHGLKEIGARAFLDCYNLTQLIIPSSVNFAEDSAFPREFFFNCGTLRTLIYLGTTAPQRWTASGNTYVPDLSAYSTPFVKMNDAKIIEMVTFNESTFDYTGTAPKPTYTNNVTGWTANLDFSVIKKDAGNYTTYIPATFTNGIESFSTQIKYTYTINKRTITAFVADASRVYGDNNPTFNISYSGFVNGDNESIFTTKPTATTTATVSSNVGTYPITISGGVATNYEITYVPGTLTITKAPLTACVSDTTNLYGDVNFSFALEFSGLKNGESEPAWEEKPTFQTDATKKSGVGNYTVKAVGGVLVNYELNDISTGTLTITPAPLEIKVRDVSRRYYEENPQLGYSCIGFVNDDDVSMFTVSPIISTAAKIESNVGQYEIKVSGASIPNYTVSYTNGTLNILPRTINVSVENESRIYGEENPAFEISYSGFVGNDDESVLVSKAKATTTAKKNSNVGKYKIELAGAAADNYVFAYTPGWLTINKAEQTLTWDQSLENLTVGDQVELQAVSTSGLHITYTLGDNGLAEIYTTGTKIYMDCKKSGYFQIRAVQQGNENYYSSARVTKSVVIKEDPSAIYSVHNSQIKIENTSNGIVLKNAKIDDIVRIYTLDGMMVKSVKVQSLAEEIALQRGRVYIVKIGDNAVKLKI